MATTLWTKEQVKLAFHLYCQIPFGRIDGRNKEIVELAKVIGRTSDAVAMKMLNISSLDPAITSTGRVGLGNASALDREVWAEFQSDWEKLAVESELLRQQLDKNTFENFEAENEVAQGLRRVRKALKSVASKLTQGLCSWGNKRTGHCRRISRFTAGRRKWRFRFFTVQPDLCWRRQG